MVKREWSLDELKHKAEAYCAAAEHCCFEVSNKLQQWGANSDEIESVLAHLTAQRYIDEARYCAAFTHDKIRYQGWGRVKIKAALYAKHIPSQYIAQAIEAIDEAEYLNTLQHVIATKKRTIKPNDLMVREKLIRFCLQRGFTYDEIEELIG